MDPAVDSPVSTVPSRPAGSALSDCDPRQAAALDALIGGATKAEAARRVSVARSTITRWCRLPAFIAALAEARADLLEDVAESFARAATDAATYIGDVASGRVKADAQRLAACRDVLDRAGVRPADTDARSDARRKAIESGGAEAERAAREAGYT